MLGWLWAPAAALSFIAGFALQRGGICSVRAVRDVVEKRRWTLFASLLECALWSLALIALAHAAGAHVRVLWPQHQLLGLALAGGSLFGLGALINGACAFGSVGRCASGDLAFLAMLPGFALGGIAAIRLGLGASLATLAPQGNDAALAASVLVLVGAGLVRLAMAARNAHSEKATARMQRARRWPAPIAMAVIALANVGLMLIVTSWPYTSFMIDVLTDRAGDAGVRAAIVAIFFAGAVAGAVSAGRFRWRLAWREVAAHFSGGVLMGFGSALIPGGNDALVLLGLPLLQPAALLAYAGMLAAIATPMVLGSKRARALSLGDASMR